MGEIKYMRGNQAAAEAGRMARIQFMGAYPIPPSAEIMESISTFIRDGQLKAGFIEADGEDSAQASCFAAACSGLRVMNATSSQGLALMHQLLHLFTGSRMPMVMVIGNRSLFAPHAMLCEHTDSISQRDTGWLQFYCETIQELFDTIIQGYKISENPEIRLPIMVCEDGYWLSHSLERIDVPTQAEVDAFLPPYKPSQVDYLKPGGLSIFTSFGVFDNWFTEFRYQEDVAKTKALQVIEDVDKEFGRNFGRHYGGLVAPYMVEDAEIIMIGMGSMMATTRYAIDVLRSAGKKVGMIKIRSFRPFPSDKLAKIVATSNAKMVVVAEKDHLGALFDEVRSSLYGLNGCPGILGFVVGLNGRDFDPYNVIDLFEQGFENIGNRSLPRRPQIYFVRKRD
jgi:pyruvate/2-oxoacid:ferredoxin oxidoreductase alpha subunit